MSLLKAWNRESYPLGHNTEFKVDPFAKYGGESIVNKLAQEEKKKETFKYHFPGPRPQKLLLALRELRKPQRQLQTFLLRFPNGLFSHRRTAYR